MRVPGVGAALHAGGPEQVLLRPLVQGLAGDRLHHPLQPEKRLARIIHALAGGDPRAQRLPIGVRAPARQAAAVAQDVAHGDPRQLRVVIGQEIGPVVVHQRAVERKRPGIHQLQHQVGEHRLAQRGALEHAVGVDRRTAVHVGHAEPAVPRQLALVHHGDGDAGHAEGTHPFRQRGQEGIGRDPARIVAHAGRRTPRRRQQGQCRAARGGRQEAASMDRIGNRRVHAHTSAPGNGLHSSRGPWRQARPAGARQAHRPHGGIG